MALLEIRGLHTWYGSVEALHGVDITVDAGEIVTLLGSNGAGKTTTLRTVSGLLRPKRGSVTFDGIEITRMKPHRIVSSGLIHVPEGRGIFSGLSVNDNLTLGGFVQRRDGVALEARRRGVYEVFERLGERRDQAAGTLSGGEQQMLAIGRALMGVPKVLALDEPSLGLAPLLVREVLNVIADLRDRGLAILLVEQNAREALRIADRGYVLETGRTVLNGAANELVNDRRVHEAYLGGQLSSEGVDAEIALDALPSAEPGG